MSFVLSRFASSPVQIVQPLCGAYPKRNRRVQTVKQVTWPTDNQRRTDDRRRLTAIGCLLITDDSLLPWTNHSLFFALFSLAGFRRMPMSERQAANQVDHNK
jgi:hypothetical protein